MHYQEDIVYKDNYNALLIISFLPDQMLDLQSHATKLCSKMILLCSLVILKYLKAK